MQVRGWRKLRMDTQKTYDTARKVDYLLNLNQPLRFVGMGPPLTGPAESTTVCWSSSSPSSFSLFTSVPASLYAERRLKVLCWLIWRRAKSRRWMCDPTYRTSVDAVVSISLPEEDPHS